MRLGLTLPLAFCLAFLLAGFLDTSRPAVGTPEVRIGALSSQDVNLIRLQVDTDVEVPVSNPRKESLTVTILSADLVAQLKDGTQQGVAGSAETVVIPPGGSGTVRIKFLQVPVLLRLQTKPLSLKPVVDSYNVIVRYRGEVRLWGLVPYSKTETETRLYRLSDILLDENLIKDQILRAFS